MNKKTELLICICVVFILSSSFSGCISSTSKADYSYAPANPSPGSIIQFVAPSSSEYNKYLWDFGDDTISLEENPTHIFNETGTYAVKLTIWDNSGNSYSTTKKIAVEEEFNNPPTNPILSLGYSEDLEPWIIYPIFATSTDADGDNISYCYEWGDGSSYCSLDVDWPSGFRYKQDHSWETPGSYTVKVKAVDARGAESENSSIEITVVDSYKIPYFNISTIDGDNFSISDNLGKVIFIDLFATTCGGCVNEAQSLKEIYDTYGNNVSIISMSVEHFNPYSETLENVTAFKSNVAAEWDFAIDTLSTNVTGNFIKGFTSGFSVPALFILDKEGHIAYSAQGYSTVEALTSIINELI